MSYAPNSDLKTITSTYCIYEELKEENKEKEEEEGKRKSRRSSSISSHSSYPTTTTSTKPSVIDDVNATMNSELLNSVVFLPDSFANVESPIVVENENENENDM